MLKYLLIVSFLFLTNKIYCQQLNVDLSIKWMKSMSYLYNNKGLDSIPYLKITYANLSDDHIYFLKVYQNSVGLPRFFTSMENYCYKMDDFSKLDSTTVKWNVFVGGRQPDDYFWNILPDSMDYFSEHESNIMNDILYSIYATLFDTLIYDKTGSVTSENEKKSIDWLGDFKDNIVFMQPNGTYSDYYSLVGFKILKGYYTFMFPINKMSDHLDVNLSLDSINHCVKSEKIYLPDWIDKYSLYRGCFNSNKITISF